MGTLWHNALEKIPFQDSADSNGFCQELFMLVEVSSRTIIQFLALVMALGGQRETDLRYICGFVKRDIKYEMM